MRAPPVYKTKFVSWAKTGGAGARGGPYGGLSAGSGGPPSRARAAIPPEAEICPRGPLVGPYGGVRGVADPMPRPRRHAGSHGVMDVCAPCRVPPMRRPRCPSIECGGERRADARARHMPLFGALGLWRGRLPPSGAPTARKGPTGALRAVLRQTVKGGKHGRR